MCVCVCVCVHVCVRVCVRAQADEHLGAGDSLDHKLAVVGVIEETAAAALAHSLSLHITKHHV